MENSTYTYYNNTLKLIFSIGYKLETVSTIVSILMLADTIMHYKLNNRIVPTLTFLPVKKCLVLVEVDVQSSFVVSV